MADGAKRERVVARWVAVPEPDPAQVRDLAAALSLPEIVARILVARGHGDAGVAASFLRPRRERLHSPFAMRGMEEAVERILRAIHAGETILVHGDYDVDGICSTTILTRMLRALGASVVPFIPHRLADGYDLGPAGVAAAREARAGLVLTCDCGTSAHGPIGELAAQGIDVIVTDHHLARGPRPPALVLLNPRDPACEYADPDLCAAGIAFKLALALAERGGIPDTFVWRMLDLVALATVADVAPLRGENRILVRYGLRLLAETENLGLRALIRAAGMEGKPLTAGRVGFTLAPRLNAAGRVGHALRGVELLLSETVAQANEIARELEELNRSRQELDRATLDEARRMADALPSDTHAMVLAREGWHPGVVGIVASRIVEEYARPTVLVALDGSEGKGSGRSINSFDLHAALAECADLLLRYGGHRAAAGVTVAAERVSDFARRFDEVARASLSREDLLPQLRIDAELPLSKVTDELERVFRHFEPFGIANPAPVFAARGVRLAARPRAVGRDALRLVLRDPAGAELEVIGWGMGGLAPTLEDGCEVDVAFRLERDEWRGVSRLQGRLAAIVRR